VVGNVIGPDVSGTADLGNNLTGVLVANATNTMIGGTSAAARNLISGNGGNGIVVQNSSSANLVQGNGLRYRS
jgi:hypothetical protein